MWFCLLLSHPTKPFLTCKFVAVWKPKAVTAILMWLLLYVATVNQIWSNHTHTVLMKLFYNKYTGKKVSQASATLVVNNFAMGVICKDTEIWRLWQDVSVRVLNADGSLDIKIFILLWVYMYYLTSVFEPVCIYNQGYWVWFVAYILFIYLVGVAVPLPPCISNLRAGLKNLSVDLFKLVSWGVHNFLCIRKMNCRSQLCFKGSLDVWRKWLYFSPIERFRMFKMLLFGHFWPLYCHR